MVRAIDGFVELLLREKLRDRSLKLKLGQRSCLVLVDFSLRERRVANDVGKQVEGLVQVLDQTARVHHAGHRGQPGVRAERRSDSVNLFGNVFARALGGPFTQQRGGETCQTMVVSLV